MEEFPKTLSDFSVSYRDESLFMEDVSLERIVDAVGTPAYVYSQAHIQAQYKKLAEALKAVDYRVHYAVKANSNLALLKLLGNLGAGYDIVSGGELSRVLSAQGDPGSVIFSGVGKATHELDLALKAGIECFNVESAGELDRLAERAALLSVVAPVAIRFNPNVDAKTHPYISTGLKENKFGVLKDQALALYRRAAESEHLRVYGIACHIGSQIAEPTPLIQALEEMLSLRRELAQQGIEIDHLDLGGGFGVRYRDEPEFDVGLWGREVARLLNGTGLRISIEPGRFLTANAGILLSRVEYLKEAVEDAKSFAVVDAAMNDLIRPALYGAWHEVVPVCNDLQGDRLPWDIVGPICESGDFIAKQRTLTLKQGKLLAILSSGAYGATLASNYNTRGRAPEVLVHKDNWRLVRRRENLQDQLITELP